MFETVVLATDGSESVERAIDVGLDVADRFDATVHAISVIDVGEVDGAPAALRDELETALERHVEDALESVESRTDTPVTTTVREGRPAVELCQFAREVDADVLVTGTRGRHGEHRPLLGSVAERVVRSSPVPVLTVRQLDEHTE